MNKIFKVLIAISLIFMFLILLGFVAHKEQQDRKKCTDKGLVYVQPFQERAYCAAGAEIN